MNIFIKNNKYAKRAGGSKRPIYKNDEFRDISSVHSEVDSLGEKGAKTLFYA